MEENVEEMLLARQRAEDNMCRAMMVVLDVKLWAEFCDRLGGPDGCNFRNENGETRWDCDHTFTKTRKIVSAMDQEWGGDWDWDVGQELYGDDPVEDFISFMRSEGACCDCEILFNVGEKFLEFPSAGAGSVR